MKISVITAVYNAKDTVAEAIESVLAQDYAHVEIYWMWSYRCSRFSFRCLMRQGILI